MFQRIALLCLSLLLIASGTASAAQDSCPASDARQMTHVMPAMNGDCDMGMGSMDHSQPEDQDGPSHDRPCCCPAIVAALPIAAAPDDARSPYPPLFDIPLDASPVSVASIPEPPPPRT